MQMIINTKKSKTQQMSTATAHLTRQSGGKQAQEPISGNDGHLTTGSLQVLVQFWQLVVSQLLQH